MKRIFILLVLLLPLFACAQEAAQEQQTTAERNKMLYSMGFLLGDNLKKQLILDNEDDYKAVSQGMRDSLLNKKAQINVEQYKPQIIQKYQEDAQKIAENAMNNKRNFWLTSKKKKGSKL